MLRKMIKHEWKSTWRFLTVINLLTILLACLGKLSQLFKGPVPEYIRTLYISFYVLLLIVSGCATMFYLVIRFYRTLYTDQGYLTNCLPVSADCHLLSKLLVFFLWMLINSACVLLSVGILLLGIRFPEYLPQLLELIVVFLGGGNFVHGIIYLAAAGIVGTLESILVFYFSISVGCQFRTHRVLASAGAFVAAYVVMQVLSTALIIFSGYFTGLLNPSAYSGNFRTLEDFWKAFAPTYTLLIVGSFILLIVSSAVCYLIARYLLSKRLNLYQ